MAGFDRDLFRFSFRRFRFRIFQLQKEEER